jgi:hypothetical protein
MKRCRLKRYNFKIRNKMKKEAETSDKAQNGNDSIADVSTRYCVECDCDITDSKYNFVCEHCRLQT